jgi:hypothetical protein
MSPRVRLTLSRILAGVAIPILSAVFSLLCDAIYQRDASGIGPELPVMLLCAAVLGAPFAIPVLLAVRLRNTWRTVPFLAAAAAGGIDLQNTISSSDSLVLDLVWIVPAICGTAAALLLKWHERRSAFAIAAFATIAVLVVAVQGGEIARKLAPAYAAADSWSMLRAGMRLYTGDGYSSAGQAICPTLATLLASERNRSGLCKIVSRGTPAIVDAILACAKTDPDWGFESPHVKLHALDGSWVGFTDAGNLQPDIPVGTLLAMHRDWGAPLMLESERGAPTPIGESAMVTVLRYDPTAEAPLYVKILDGSYRNRTGRMEIGFAQTGRLAFGEYDLQYPDNSNCEIR